MDRPEALSRLAVARVGHLATTRPNGDPHIVPATFAIDGVRIVTAIDHKPKRTGMLQRLSNIQANPVASFLVDQYSEDWTALWWVRVDGHATIHESGNAWSSGVSTLSNKYHQYQEQRPSGPIISIAIDRVRFWEGTP